MESFKLLSRVLVQGSKLFWTSGLGMFLFPECGYTFHNLYCKDLAGTDSQVSSSTTLGFGSENARFTGCLCRDHAPRTMTLLVLSLPVFLPTFLVLLLESEHYSNYYDYYCYSASDPVLAQQLYVCLAA